MRCRSAEADNGAVTMIACGNNDDGDRLWCGGAVSFIVQHRKTLSHLHGLIDQTKSVSCHQERAKDIRLSETEVSTPTKCDRTIKKHIG